jgi:6-phosphofructokinase 1
MGRHTGFIALESGIAGGAEELVIPEIPITTEELCQHLERYFGQGKKSAIVVVAEADRPGETFNIAEEVKKRTGLESRVCILGHIQRGGAPTVRDRILASKLGVAAVQALVDGRGSQMVGEINRNLAYTSLKDTWQKKKQLHPGLTDLIGILAE